MSVRLCYLRRADRGASLRTVRIVGQGVDERFPPAGGPPPPDQSAWIAQAAEWVAERLSHSRAGGKLELVCLDVEGAACTWLTSPSAEPAVVAAVARLGTDGIGDFGETGASAAPAPGPIEFFAGEAPESTIQPFALPAHDAPTQPQNTETKKGKKSREPSSNGHAKRIAILAQTDVPARLFIDALDSEGIETLAACSLWHAMARAWDPASPLREPTLREQRAEVVADSSNTTAILLVDAGDGETPARAVWAWSRAGEVLAAGSARLRSRASDDGPTVDLRESDASRLAAEWVSWSLQLGEAPRRVIAILPERVDGDANAFGQALVRNWPGATVDATTDPDPIGATLSRLVAAFEATAERTEDPTGGHALVELSSRPGRAHRRLYMWAALFVLMAAVLAGIVAWQVGQRASSARAAAADFRTKWMEDIRTHYPAAFNGPANTTALFNLRQEYDKRRQEAGPSKLASAAPILEELETISLILSSAEDVALESLDLVSGANVKIVVVTKDLRSAERVAYALRHIAGSRVLWDKVDPVYTDTTNTKGEPATRMTFNAVWDAPQEDAR